MPSAPRWYFTSPEPCAAAGFMLPSNSVKIFEYGLPTMLASTLRRPRCGMPMTTSSSSCSAHWSMTASIIGMTASAPSSEKRFWPTYLVCRNVSNASAALSLLRMYFCCATVGLTCFCLDALLQPLQLIGLEDVRVLDTDVAAVRVAQDREHVAQLHPLLAVEAADVELAVEVPQRQAVGGDVEVGVAAELVLDQLQRIGVGHQVTAVAVGRDQLEHAGALVDAALRGTSLRQRTGSYGIASAWKISS